jgi:hypothetical protein
MLTLVVVKQALLPYSQLLAGPASTTTTMVVATALLWRRQLSWSDLGLRWPVRVKPVVGYTALTLAVMVAMGVAGSSIAEHFGLVKTTSGRFDFVVGNLGGYLLVMLLVWTHGSFFEEMLFRAFLISRWSDALGGGRMADVAAVVGLALFFGYRHYYYQGGYGAIVTGMIGLALGMLYLWFGRRNLLPLIIAHGVMNSLSQTLRFLGD